MTNKRRIIESVFSRLLFESTTASLAAVIKDDGTRKRIYIYDSQDFLSALSKKQDSLKASYAAAKGYIDVKQPSTPCAGAWQVLAAWGPGIGKLLYTAAASLTPNGKLMPDRLSVSPEAGAAWERASWDLPYQDLDDHRHKTCTALTHTDDPSDDCRVLNEPNRPWLDRAYDYSKMLGVGKAKLKEMIRVHEECMAAAEDKFVERVDPNEMSTEPETLREEMEWAIRNSCHQRLNDEMGWE